MKDKKILIADDDYHICELIKLYLEKEGFVAQIACDGMRALALFKENPPDLVVLDIMMPKMDGFQVCREIRRISNVPVILLTAKGETFDKVLGLELGADDYIVKPFDTRELVARIKAVIRRTGQNTAGEKEIVFANLSINLTTYELKIAGKQVEAAPKEIELLYFLAFHPNRVFTREQILEEVWGYDFYGDSRTVDVHIKRLRKKIEGYEQNWNLTTVWGVGYKFEVK